MTTPDLDKLEALLAAATPGPWAVSELSRPKDRTIVVDTAEGHIATVCYVDGEAGDTGQHGAALIAAAINSLPGLIARIRQLEATEADHIQLIDLYSAAFAALRGAPP